MELVKLNKEHYVITPRDTTLIHEDIYHWLEENTGEYQIKRIITQIIYKDFGRAVAYPDNLIYVPEGPDEFEIYIEFKQDSDASLFKLTWT